MSNAAFCLLRRELLKYAKRSIDGYQRRSIAVGQLYRECVQILPVSITDLKLKDVTYRVETTVAAAVIVRRCGGRALSDDCRPGGYLPDTLLAEKKLICCGFLFRIFEIHSFSNLYQRPCLSSVTHRVNLHHSLMQMDGLILFLLLLCLDSRCGAPGSQRGKH